MTDDVRKLLGGYATGTLTDEEKKVLFEAALHDDSLFAALADEHALRELLDDSTVRAQVLQATEEPRFSVVSSLRDWFEHPKSKALVATAAVLLVIISFNQFRQRSAPDAANVAELRAPAAVTSPVPSPKTENDVLARRAEQRPAPAPSTPTASPEARTAETKAQSLKDSVTREQPATSAGQEREMAKEAVVAQATAPPPPPAPAASPVVPPAGYDVSASALVAGNPAGKTAGLAGPRATSIRSADAGVGGAANTTETAAGRIGAFQRAAGTSVTPLRYELLRKNPAGDFEAVPADHLFVPGDVLRLRVTSTRNGAVGISSNPSNATVSRTVAANTWTEVPQAGGIAITPEIDKLIVAFAPSAEAPSTTLLESAEARAKRPGVPSVSLEIPIRQKKP